MAIHPPSQTLYIKNLKDRVRKDEMKRVLYCLFETYGHIMDIVYMRNKRMRGQAFVVFEDVQSAIVAQKALDRFTIYEKPIDIDFARTLSRKVKIVQDMERAEALALEDEMEQ